MIPRGVYPERGTVPLPPFWHSGWRKVISMEPYGTQLRDLVIPLRTQVVDFVDEDCLSL